MDNLLNVSYFALFLIITLGLVAGRIKVKGFSLDMSAIIFIALFLGHLGLRLPKEFQYVGLLLFIFTIGMQAGPGFFNAFKQYGRKVMILAGIIVTVGALTTLACMLYFDIEPAMAVGLFNGALTSTPGLAAAVEITNSPLASIGYGIAYPFGVIGLVLLINILPILFRINVGQCEADFEASLKKNQPQLIPVAYRVENPNINGKTLGELNLPGITNCVVSRVKHAGITTTPTAETRLESGDIIRAVGYKTDHEKVSLFVGQTVHEEMELAQGYDVQWVLVTNKSAINKQLQEINLGPNYNATIVRVRRAGIDISPQPKSTLRFGDRVLIASNADTMKQVASVLGNDNKRLSETDFLPITLGIVLGVILGKITIPVFGWFNFSLGITGGVLAVALILSGIGKTGPIIWSMSSNSNQLFRELGLLLFLATVGCSAGEHLMATISEHGAQLLGIGALITIIPVLIGALAGKYLLKINFLTLLGVITGSMTSTPGLAAINGKSDTNIAQIAYAAVYPIALVLMILFSNLLFHL